MSLSSKFKDAFVSTISDIDENKAKELSDKLHDLEADLDRAANDVRDKLMRSNSNFGIDLENGQVREIMKKSLDNLKSGL